MQWSNTLILCALFIQKDAALFEDLSPFKNQSGVFLFQCLKKTIEK
jgi:hypothetical protein